MGGRSTGYGVSVCGAKDIVYNEIKFFVMILKRKGNGFLIYFFIDSTEIN